MYRVYERPMPHIPSFSRDIPSFSRDIPSLSRGIPSFSPDCARGGSRMPLEIDGWFPHAEMANIEVEVGHLFKNQLSLTVLLTKHDCFVIFILFL